MATRRYVPDAGDIVWLEFDPQAGHGQAGHRPALVVSPAIYNSRTGLMVCCPMTTQVKGYPFEVLVDAEGGTSAVLSDQVKSLDWKVRRARKKGKASGEAMLHVRAKIKALLSIP
jgi:mRNA interferase MazF